LYPSPNAEEALQLLSLPLPPTKELIETAALTFFLSSPSGPDSVIIRSGHLGAYVLTGDSPGRWVNAYWGEEDAEKVVDVLGAGNAFLGGLAAGMSLTGGDIYQGR
jgi:sugar/nucleoside kinase (ribokinase family)